MGSPQRCTWGRTLWTPGQPVQQYVGGSTTAQWSRMLAEPSSILRSPVVNGAATVCGTLHAVCVALYMHCVAPYTASV